MRDLTKENGDFTSKIWNSWEEAKDHFKGTEMKKTTFQALLADFEGLIQSALDQACWHADRNKLRDANQFMAYAVRMKEQLNRFREYPRSFYLVPKNARSQDLIFNLSMIVADER